MKRHLQRWPGDLLALSSGSLMPFAYAPFTFGWLALLAVALLLVSWQGSTPGRAAMRGWLFGLAMYGGGIYWVYYSIHHFGHAPLPLAVTLAALLVAGMAAYSALTGYLLQRYFNNGSAAWRLVAVAPALWLLVESLRGVLFGGFPWLAPGYALTNTPALPLAAIAGVALLSWLVVASGGAIALLLLDRRKWQPLLLLPLSLWLLALLPVSWHHPLPNTLDVALIQGNIPQHLKWLPEQRQRTIDHYETLSRAQHGADLIVWPETALPAFFHQEEERLAMLASELALSGTTLLIGAPLLEGDGSYYNALIDAGDPSNRYLKRHLVPFGEYMPLRLLFEPLLSALKIPMADFSAGADDQPLLHAGNVPIGGSICYEAIFGEEIARSLPEGQLLVNISNDAWFGDTLAPHQHLQMAQVRAVESGRPLLRSTNTGVSAIIAPDGSLQRLSGQFHSEVIRDEVVPATGTTPYVRFGDSPLIVFMILLLLYSQHGRITSIRRRLAE
jgi:apolipoprotein N-acyltransferase